MRFLPGRVREWISANIGDAIKFRNAGKELSSADEAMIGEVKGPTKCDLFRDLISDWKADHFLLIEDSARQTYEKLLPSLDFLADYPA